MKHTLLIFTFLTLGKLLSAAPDLLVVANKAGDTVYVFDAHTYEKLGETTAGRGPHEVSITPGGKHAWITNTEGRGDTISVIDLNEIREIRRLPIGLNAKPHGIQFSNDGLRAFVTAEGTEAVIEISARDESILRTFPTEQPGTHMLHLSADEKTLYASNLPNEKNNLTIIDIESGKIIAHHDTGAGAEGMGLTRDGAELWICNRRADTVSILDTATNEVVETFDLAGFPLRIQFTPDGRRALISCATAGEVAVIDVVSRRLVQRIATGEFPEGLAIEPNGARAFISNSRSNTVTVLNLETLEIIHTLNTGRGPDGIGFRSGSTDAR